jgi:hypothetical protein
MFENSVFSEAAPLDYEMWRDVLRSQYGAEIAISERDASFVAWLPRFSVCGFEACGNRIWSGSDARCNAYHGARMQQHVRLAGMDDYVAIFQSAGRAAVNQNDQTVEAAAGDIQQ